MSLSPDEKQILLSFANSVSSLIDHLPRLHRCRNYNYGSSRTTRFRLFGSMPVMSSVMASCCTVALRETRAVMS